MFEITDFVDAIEEFKVARERRGDDLGSRNERVFQQSLVVLDMTFRKAVLHALRHLTD